MPHIIKKIPEYLELSQLFETRRFTTQQKHDPVVPGIRSKFYKEKLSVFRRRPFTPCNCVLYHCIWWRRPPGWKIRLCLGDLRIFHPHFQLAFADDVIDTKEPQSTWTKCAANFAGFLAAGVKNHRAWSDVLRRTATQRPLTDRSLFTVTHIITNTRWPIERKPPRLIIIIIIIIIIIKAMRLTWYKCKSTARPRYNTRRVKTQELKNKNQKKIKIIKKNNKTVVTSRHCQWLHNFTKYWPIF